MIHNDTDGHSRGVFVKHLNTWMGKFTLTPPKCTPHLYHYLHVHYLFFLQSFRHYNNGYSSMMILSGTSLPASIGISYCVSLQVMQNNQRYKRSIHGWILQVMWSHIYHPHNQLSRFWKDLQMYYIPTNYFVPVYSPQY